MAETQREAPVSPPHFPRGLTDCRQTGESRGREGTEVVESTRLQTLIAPIPEPGV